MEGFDSHQGMSRLQDIITELEKLQEIRCQVRRQERQRPPTSQMERSHGSPGRRSRGAMYAPARYLPRR